MMIDLFTFVALLGFSYYSTGIFRNYALKKGMMDLPNERSSHTMPTPRGGGLVFVLVALGVWVGILAWQGFSQNHINEGNIYFLLSSILIATLGFVDDKRQLSAKFRLISQFIVFSVFLYWLLGGPLLSNLQNSVSYYHIGMISFLGFSYLFLLWMTNLFNFMDGIDGIAATEAIFFFAGIALLYHDLLFFPLSDLTWILCALLIGFLLWNFPKAKLFMGDVGSSFLGAFIALISIYLATISWVIFMVCVILLANFITDATLTLLQRLSNGENVFQAHRSHAYQHASRYFGSHVPVTLGITAINVFWLFPWAYVVSIGMVNAIVATVIAYTPIVALAFYFNAGKKETTQEIDGSVLN